MKSRRRPLSPAQVQARLYPRKPNRPVQRELQVVVDARAWLERVSAGVRA